VITVATRATAASFRVHGHSSGGNRKYKKDDTIFTQGDPCDGVFYVQEGRCKITVVSERGKEAVPALHEKGDFFGEGCLIGQPLRLATATAMTDSSY
jgi:CRP/FNR family cyclic AMP-dependent transcriptional regulator